MFLGKGKWTIIDEMNFPRHCLSQWKTYVASCTKWSYYCRIAERAQTLMDLRAPGEVYWLQHLSNIHNLA